MLILVTGGSGLVGNALKKIRPDFTYISSKDVNLLDFEETLTYFKKINPTCVIHLAAVVGGLFKNIHHNDEMFEKNIKINMNVLKCSHSVGVKNLIACLSTCVYPHTVTYPITEDQFHMGEPHDSNFGYSYAKRMLEVQCRVYNKKFNTRYICVIPTNVFGTHDNFSLDNGHVIPALIHKFYNSINNNEHLVLPGTGNAFRQFIHSDKLAQIIIELLFKENLNYSLYNICENEEYECSIKDIVEHISKIYNFSNYSFDKVSSDGQMKKTASNTRIKKELPNHFRKDPLLFENLRDTIQWFKENHNNVRL